jgi:lysophospholipase L1-like esterase
MAGPVDRPPLPRRVLWSFRLLTVLLVTLLAALAGEVGLRLAWGGFYLAPPGMRARPHEVRGWENRPSVSFEYGEPEFHHRVVHDARGFRGKGARAEKAPGVRRVLALGDSFVWGVGAAEEETIPARLEALDPSLEVLNAGVIGYATHQEWLLFREHAGGLAPDAVLLFFFWNDLGEVLEGGRLGFSLEESGALRYAPTTLALEDPGPRAPSLLERSYLYRFASDAAKSLRFRWEIAAGRPTHKTGARDAAELERAWALVRGVLERLRDDCKARGTPLLLVAIPDQAQVHPEWPVIGLADYVPGVPARALALAQDLGIPALDLTPALLAAREAGSGPLYYRRDRHFTPAGYDAAARAVGPWLAERLPKK